MKKLLELRKTSNEFREKQQKKLNDANNNKTQEIINQNVEKEPEKQMVEEPRKQIVEKHRKQIVEPRKQIVEEPKKQIVEPEKCETPKIDICFKQTQTQMNKEIINHNVNVILCCLNNFQNYILINIEQLIKLGHKSIYIITNKHLTEYFNCFNNNSNVKIIYAEDLNEDYDFNNKTKLDKNGYKGLWLLSSLRFFYIYSFMKKYNITNVFHIENDVLIYYNVGVLVGKLEKTKMYVPFDSYSRNIASILFIPNKDVFKMILDEYNYDKNDMFNFPIIYKNTNLIDIFPIFNDENSINKEVAFVSKNISNIGYIFDAAAIGQYLGGIDSIHTTNDTTGFVNETCVIKYNNYNIFWNTINNINKPFININNIEYPIFNLHIHSKRLEKFV